MSSNRFVKMGENFFPSLSLTSNPISNSPLKKDQTTVRNLTSNHAGDVVGYDKTEVCSLIVTSILKSFGVRLVTLTYKMTTCWM